jgi:hypothetical protein
MTDEQATLFHDGQTGYGTRPRPEPPRATLITAPGLRPGRYLTLQQRYEEWRATPDGQDVYDAVRRAALRLRGRGFQHYGIGALWEAARYDHALKVGPDVDGWKLNDHYRSRMARELMMREPELAGFFELRELRA